LATSWLIYYSLFPQSPFLWKGCLLPENPPLGPLSLKGQRKLLASLKWGPTVWISLIKSSTLLIPCFPSDSATMVFDERGILCLFTFPYPLLRMSFLIVSLEGYPKVMYGSTFLRRLDEALLTLTKVPLWICLSLSNLKILMTFGLSLLIPLILTTNASLDWAGT